MPPSLEFDPIGYVRTGRQVKFEALHQPVEASAEQHILEIVPGCGYEDGLRDLQGFTRIWLIWWFHRNTTWRPMVLPPRGPAVRRGVFATRSPHRPNPIGITPVQLLAVERGRLLLGPCDLVDGTPVLDIKPYLPAYDAFPLESPGWTAAVAAEHATTPGFEVKLSSLAEEQAEWLQREWNIDFRPRLLELLSRDPTPHRTRRIKKLPGTDLLCVGCGAWRALFRREESRIRIVSLEPGFPSGLLQREGSEKVPDRQAQLEFLAHWESHLEQKVPGGQDR